MTGSIWPLLLASVENFVLTAGALAILAFATAAFARATSRNYSWHPATLTRVYASALVVPPFVSAWLVSASILPAVWLGADRWVEEHDAQHTLHLLNIFTASVNPALSYTAFAFILLVAVAAVYMAASAYARIGRVIRRLDVSAEPAAPERVKQVEETCRKHGIDVGLVTSRYPLSFVWGYTRSKLVVSTGLLNALSAKELAALLEHEAAHHKRRDNLSKWLLSVCRYSSPVFPLNGLLYRWWGEQVEMVCDEVAARRTSAPVEVAGALVQLRRLTLARPFKAQQAELGFLAGGGDGFERRVTRVLSLAAPAETTLTTRLSRSPVRATLFFGSAFALTLIFLFWVSPLAIHRLVESLLHPF